MSKKTNTLKEKYKLSEVKPLEEALKLLTKVSTSKFTGSVDIDILLNLKENKKNESIRGSVSLPHQLGETKQVIVFCEPEVVEIALKAGAVDAGLEDLIEKVLENKVEYDIVLATPTVMPKIAKLGKVLGPKGLMPSPKNGTITTDIEKAVKSFKSGRINFRMTQGQNAIRAKVGKLDMPIENLKDNILEFVKAISTEVKGMTGTPFLRQLVLKPTMGPSLKVDINDIMSML
jgi:large subunit ribosomal protein L1